MKANSRRRVLISSLAMLLVALVALSTATYAWFTNQVTATAKTVTVKANAAVGLKISADGDEGEWKTDAKFDNGSGVALSPVSVNYTDGNAVTKITSATASSATTLTAISDVAIPGFTAPVKDNDNYAVYQFKAAYTGETSTQYLYLTGLTIADAQTGKNAANYARVAIIDNSTKKVVDVFDLSGGTTSALTGASTTGVASVSTTKAAATGLDLKLSTTALTNTSSASPLSFSLLVWFEGQDADCVDANAGNTANIELFFEMRNA